jgi:hypothetical protein
MSHQKASAHHAAAAEHHSLAMQLHRSASRHYLIGKDYAHAADQALAAHGHALLALADADAACRLHGVHLDLAQPPLPLPEAKSCCAEQHIIAANHHQHAVELQAKAAASCDCADTAETVGAATRALEHAQNAVNHSNVAAMLHATTGGASS